MSKHTIHFYGKKDLGLKNVRKFCLQVKYKEMHPHLQDKTVIGKILDAEFKMDISNIELSEGCLLVTYESFFP